MFLTPVIAATISAAILIGFLTTLMDSIRPALAVRFDRPAAELPNFSRRLHLCWIPLMPITGWLIDSWGVHGIFFSGSLVLSFGVAWLAVARRLQTLALGVYALAWGGAALTLTCIRLMLEAFPFGNGPSPESSLCVGFLFIAVAALLTQGLYPRILARLGYRNTLLLSALFCLAPACIASFLEPSALPAAIANPSPERLLHNPRLWLLTLLIFFWFPLEHSLDVWPRPFLAELGYTGKAITTLIVGFWFWFLASRLAMSWVLLQGFEIWIVLILALIPPMVLGNLVGAYAPSSGYFGFWLVGASYGPMLPAFLGMTMDFFDNRCLILGIMLAIDSLCALVIRPTFERYVRGHSARESMRVPLIFGLLLSAVILVLALIRYA